MKYKLFILSLCILNINVTALPQYEAKYKFISEVKSSSPIAFGVVKTCSIRLTNKSIIYFTIHFSS